MHDLLVVGYGHCHSSEGGSQVTVGAVALACLVFGVRDADLEEMKIVMKMASGQKELVVPVEHCH